jgi:hypothetical protein
LQNHHVVDGVGKSAKQGQLQHEQHSAGVYAVAGTILEQKGCTQGCDNPAKDIEAYGLTFTLRQSSNGHGTFSG